MELIKDYNISIKYHTSKDNMVEDTLILKLVSLGSLEILEVFKHPLSREVQSLANDFKRLQVTSGEGV